MIDVNEPVTRQLTIRDLTGNLTDATVNATTTRPDGTTGPAPTVTHPSTGTYLATWTADAAGMWRVNWSATGAVVQLEYDPWVFVQPAPSLAPPFASADELRTATGTDATALPDPKAYLVLDAVSNDIRDAAGWSISQQTGVTWTLDAPASPDLFLPTLHLTAVTSVTVDGTALASTGYEWNEWGQLTRLSGVWWRRGVRRLANVVVVATHGYPVGQVPGEVKSLCLEHSIRRLSAPDGVVKALRIDDYMETPTAITLGTGRLEDDPRVPKIEACA